MDRNEFRQINYRDIEALPDGAEIFWVRVHMIFEDEKVKDARGRTKTIPHYKGMSEEVFRTKLVKNHHRSISGMEHCLFLDPNPDYPYMNAWSGAAEGRWTYAQSGSMVEMWVRKTEEDKEWSKRMSSYNIGKNNVMEWVRQNFKAGETCLDVGACDGKWWQLLGFYLTMDACEIWEPNIETHNLRNKYRKVFACPAQKLTYDYYDLIIFGDVIEHMTVEDAQKVIDYARPRCRDMVIAVPFNYPQDEMYGNPYEKHLQPDLTPAVFDERYPGFLPIYTDFRYAYYSKI